MARQTDSDEKGVGYWLTHPGAALAALLALLGGGADLIDPVVQFAAASVTTWFPLVSTLSSLATVVPALPTDLFQQLFIVGGLVYVGFLASNLLGRVWSQLTDS